VIPSHGILRTAISVTAVFLMLHLGSHANAVVILAQDFDDNTAPDSTFVNDGIVVKSLITSNSELVPDGSAFRFTGAGRTFDGTGWGWNLFWRDTFSTGQGGPILPGNAFDITGVTNRLDLDFDFGAPSSYDSGTQHFSMNGPNGTEELRFDIVDVTLLENLSLQFSWFSTPHQELGEDFFAVTVNGTTVFQVVNGTSNMNNTGDSETVHLDLGAFDTTGDLSVVFKFQSNTPASVNDESVYFDSIKLFGDQVTVIDPPAEVPEPSAVWLFASALTVLWTLRRRKLS
jgi:hypothetical protein